ADPARRRGRDDLPGGARPGQRLAAAGQVRRAAGGQAGGRPAPARRAAGAGRRGAGGGAVADADGPARDRTGNGRERAPLTGGIRAFRQKGEFWVYWTSP